MLSVVPVQDKEEQKRFCELCSLEYDIRAMAYAAYSDGAFTGVVQFRIEGEAASITGDAFLPDAYDFEARFIMGRAVMNFIDLCGIENMFCDLSDERFARALGFRPDANGRMTLNLTGFFDTPCSH